MKGKTQKRTISVIGPLQMVSKPNTGRCVYEKAKLEGVEWIGLGVQHWY